MLVKKIRVQVKKKKAVSLTINRMSIPVLRKLANNKVKELKELKLLIRKITYIRGFQGLIIVSRVRDQLNHIRKLLRILSMTYKSKIQMLISIVSIAICLMTLMINSLKFQSILCI